jgi:hypothetical protein
VVLGGACWWYQDVHDGGTLRCMMVHWGHTKRALDTLAGALFLVEPMCQPLQITCWCTARQRVCGMAPSVCALLSSPWHTS